MSPTRAYGRVAVLFGGAFGAQTYYAVGAAGVPLPWWGLLAGCNRAGVAALIAACALAGVQMVRQRTELIITVPAAALALTLAAEHTDLIGAMSAVMWAVVAALLAVELMRGCPRQSERHLSAWRVGALALVGKCAAAVVAAAAAVPLLLLPPGQGLGLDPQAFPMEFAARAIAAGVEELALVAALVVILRAAGRPVWEVYAAAVVVRALPHLYDLPTAVSAAMVAAVAVWLYLRYGRVWPLVVAHAVGNVIAVYGGAAGRTVLLLVGVLALAVVVVDIAFKGARPSAAIRSAVRRAVPEATTA